MLVSSPVQELTGLKLMAHLFRRAGFGAPREVLELSLAKGYEPTVEELLHPERQPGPGVRPALPLLSGHEGSARDRHHSGLLAVPDDQHEAPARGEDGAVLALPLRHRLQQVEPRPEVEIQVDMFRRHCLGDFKTILLELSRDPSMIHWLDNQENTNEVHNENYGRELLELFSLGIGNYTEDDVKDCARAFTGWGLRNLVNTGPFGRNVWEFKFHPEQHDYGQKTFLGETGNFDGEDIIEIIVRQPATARFIARRLYLFFVSDQPDEAAIEALAQVFERTGGDIRAVVRALLLSDVFRSEQALYAKVKSPAEHLAGLMHLVGDYRFPEWGIDQTALEFGTWARI